MQSEFDAEARRLAKNYRGVASFGNQWGLERMKADSAYAHLELLHGDGAEPGAGVTIGFIDTGIDTTHRLFEGKTITEVRPPHVDDEDGTRFSHGTAVASVAAAPRLSRFTNSAHGVAPGADIVMFAIPAGTGSGPYVPTSLDTLGFADDYWATLLPPALEWEDGGRSVDFLNLSVGHPGIIDDYGEQDLRNALDATIPLLAQADADEKTVLVWGAGNAHGRECSAAHTDLCVNDEIDAISVEVMPGLAARIEELRGHTLAVVAVDTTGAIVGFSNRCGIAAEYCLAAPGQDIVVAYYGPAPPNDPGCPGCPEFEGVSTRHGTSYAAPMVTGGLALMKQIFRSQLSNTDLAARLLATADRSGRYADKDVYGQGLMDLHAATSPVGVLEVPLPGGSTGLQETGLRLGAAFGDALERPLAGREIAALDALGAPFWYSLGSFATAADGPSLAGELRELMAPAPDSRQDAERGSDFAAGRLVAAGRPPPRWRLGLFETPPAGARGGHLGLAGQALALDWTGDRGLSGTAFTTEGGIGRPAPASGTTLSWEPSGYPLRLRFGWMEERKTLLGTATEGAFGALAAGAVFAGVRTGAQLGGWRIGAEAEVGSVRPATGDGIVAGISPLATSAFVLDAKRETAGGGTLHLSVSQPLRVERGRASLSVPVGRTSSGEVVRSPSTADLAPSGRQVDVTAKWHRPLGGGELRLGIVATREPGHRAAAGPAVTLLGGWRRTF